MGRERVDPRGRPLERRAARLRQRARAGRAAARRLRGGQRSHVHRLSRRRARVPARLLLLPVEGAVGRDPRLRRGDGRAAHARPQPDRAGQLDRLRRRRTEQHRRDPLVHGAARGRAERGVGVGSRQRESGHARGRRGGAPARRRARARRRGVARRGGAAAPRRPVGPHRDRLVDGFRRSARADADGGARRRRLPHVLGLRPRRQPRRPDDGARVPRRRQGARAARGRRRAEGRADDARAGLGDRRGVEFWRAQHHRQLRERLLVCVCARARACVSWRPPSPPPPPPPPPV